MYHFICFWVFLLGLEEFSSFFELNQSQSLSYLHMTYTYILHIYMGECYQKKNTSDKISTDKMGWIGLLSSSLKKRNLRCYLQLVNLPSLGRVTGWINRLPESS